MPLTIGTSVTAIASLGNQGLVNTSNASITCLLISIQ